MFSFLRAAGLAGLALLGAAGAGVVGVVAWTEVRLGRTFEVPTPAIAAATDPAAVARGEHLARTILLCTDCHGADLGGRAYMDLPGIVAVNAPNLTPGRGSAIEGYGDADLARVLRHGVRPDGTGVVMMPADHLRFVSDEDLSAVLGYLRTLPPVDREIPPSEIRLGGRFLYAFGIASLLPAENFDHANPGAPARSPVEPVAKGEYLSKIGGCHVCHGETFSGGPVPGAPPELPIPPNLTPHETGLAGWTRADFERALRSGTSKDGRTLDPWMPWPYLNGLTDEEIDALWAYLQTLPPKPFGGR